MKASLIRIAPRAIAWLLVFACAAWFVRISPKTPLEFFDAAAGDSEAVERYERQEYERIDAVAAAEIRKRRGEELSEWRQMDRIALIYDLEHAPAEVERSCASIVDGFYTPAEATVEKLKAENEQYRALAEKLDKRRTEARESDEDRTQDEADESDTERLDRESQDPLASRIESLLETANRNGVSQTSYVMQIDRMMLRWFQAWLFCRRAI